MSVKYSFNNPEHNLWVLCHQTYNIVSKCEDKAYAEGGLTSQQMGVLMAIKHIQGPATPTEVARRLDRSTNNISMITDRMEKSGLLRKRRDAKDRRTLRLSITRKGEESFEQALKPGWELAKNVLSGFTKEEIQTLSGLLERMREKAYQYLSPGDIMEELPTDEVQFSRYMSKIKGQAVP